MSKCCHPCEHVQKGYVIAVQKYSTIKLLKVVIVYQHYSPITNTPIMVFSVTYYYLELTHLL